MDRLEQTILKNLIYNDEYARKVLPFIKPEYFSSSSEKILFKEIFEFSNKYKNLPTHESLIINLKDKKNISEGVLEETINLLNEIHSSKNEPTETPWLIDETESFCRRKAIYNAIMESVSIIDSNGKKPDGVIPKMLSDALGVSFDNTVGHDYLVESDDRYDFYHKVEKKIKFDLDIFNKITKGGLPQKTLNIALAGTGVGKSLFMCHVAASCLSQGQNVLYITMEMAEEKIAERIDANLLNIDLADLHKLGKKEYERKFE